jgi:hypothetical protein
MCCQVVKTAYLQYPGNDFEDTAETFRESWGGGRDLKSLLGRRRVKGFGVQSVQNFDRPQFY